MSRVIIFSRYFPSYHPRKGERTDFVEKIIKGLPNVTNLHPAIFTGKYGYNCNLLEDNNVTPKWHTIRAGHRWEVGDWFSPRVWSYKPYRSKQIIIGPDIEVKKVWEVSIVSQSLGNTNGHLIKIKQGEKLSQLLKWADVAANDGLSLKDFRNWFPGEFKGQIICWNKNIEY